MKATSTLFLLATLLLLAGWTHATGDHCNNFHDCADCVAQPFCGWCSTKVDYQSGQPGHHCAGFNKNSTNPFVCNGIYSTKTCTRGYVCDKTNYTCVLGAPGSGQDQATCEANCSAVGKTFLCDNSTFTCKIAPAGQGSSLPVCQQSCSSTHAPTSSHAPASHVPVSPHPASHHPSTPAPTEKLYMCDPATASCVVANSSEPGIPKAVCDTQCKPNNVTPPVLVGLWRAFPIGYGSVQEFDFNFTTDAVQIVDAAGQVETAAVSTVGSYLKLAMTGYALECLWRTAPGLPETYEAILACGIKAPTSVTEAMKDPTARVLFLSQCVPDGYCSFHFGPKPKLSSAFAAMLKTTDPCEAFSQNCSYCLSQQYCGWCSTNVIYSDGQVGKRCAGFNPNGGKNPFTCTGSYSTEMCLAGFVCDAVNQTCAKTTPGSGLPKSACSTSCKAKPGPPTELSGKWRGLYIQNG